MLEQQIIWKDESIDSQMVFIKQNTSLGECYDFACKYKAYLIQRMVEEQKASESKKENDTQPQEQVN